MILNTYNVNEEIPLWMGLVRINHEKKQLVCAPIPLNVLFRIIWLLWQWCIFPIEESLVDMRVRMLEKRKAELAAAEKAIGQSPESNDAT